MLKVANRFYSIWYECLIHDKKGGERTYYADIQPIKEYIIFFSLMIVFDFY